MIGHEEFLRVILEAPHDPGPRLVYADWLEEQGDTDSLNQAEFLRAECQLDTLTSGDRRRTKLLASLRRLREVIRAEWWRMLDWAPVENCVTFAYRCPKRWDLLQLTDDPSVRYCDACSQGVYYCRTPGEARQQAELGRCVAVDTRKLRLRGDLDRQDGMHRRMGRLAPTKRRRLPLVDRRPDAEPPTSVSQQPHTE
jgi:uncharacterized protein (TIGR02996 family)